MYVVQGYVTDTGSVVWLPLWASSNPEGHIDRRQTTEKHNILNPVGGVATVCHQVRCMYWGCLSLFHKGPHPTLKWYKMSAWYI